MAGYPRPRDTQPTLPSRNVIKRDKQKDREKDNRHGREMVQERGIRRSLYCAELLRDRNKPRNDVDSSDHIRNLQDYVPLRVPALLPARAGWHIPYGKPGGDKKRARELRGFKDLFLEAK